MQNNQEPHYPQWVCYHALLGDDYSYFSFDLGLIRMLPLADLDDLLQIAVEIKSPDEYGLPSDDEIETLDRTRRNENIFQCEYYREAVFREAWFSYREKTICPNQQC